MSTEQIHITDIARGGAGVGRTSDGRVVFVPFTAPGDEVEVSYHAKKKNYAHGELLKLLSASETRVTPPCTVFGRCGGCQWQHLPYELQWSTKLKGVRSAIERAGLTKIPPLETFPSNQPYGYRNRVQLRGHESTLGYFAAQSQELVPIDNCPIAREEINQALPGIRQQSEQQPSSFKVEVEVDETGGVQSTWNEQHAAHGFRQINDEQNTLLQQWISQQFSEGQTLLDLFGGAGNFSIAVAAKFRAIHCVDLSSPDQRPDHAPHHITFHLCDVLEFLKSGFVRTANAAILDPPREGLGGQTSHIALALQKLRVQELVLVGCDPDSFARDSGNFIKHGWALEKIGVFDFFPQTPHVETAGFFRRMSADQNTGN